MDKYIEDKRHKFRVVKEIPKGLDYGVWNIPGESIPGYLPYCQVLNKTCNVNTDTLLAVRIPSRLQKTALNQVGITGKDTAKKLSNYFFNKKPYLSLKKKEEMKEACIALGLAEGVNPFTFLPWSDEEIKDIWKKYN